ncbi:MAG: rcc01693 family protein [Hyphomicrobiales bacterium]
MSAAGECFPWRRLMQLGLGVLRLPPESFWRASPREIAAAFASEARTPMPRSAFDELSARFPDES